MKLFSENVLFFSENNLFDNKRTGLIDLISDYKHPKINAYEEVDLYNDFAGLCNCGNIAGTG